MALNHSLVDMPQLVLEKILSYLNHKALLAIEQASKTLKYAVDEYFCVTDKMLIGYLPEVFQNENNNCVDGLVKLIMRCGTRLRVIKIDISENLCNEPRYQPYFRRIFESIANKCPNIERIITSPKRMNFGVNVFNERNVTLRNSIMDIYATQIYESTGKGCKLRSVKFYDTDAWQQCERILDLYPNLEEMHYIGYGDQKFRTFSSLLHRFIENGLKDLKVSSYQLMSPKMVLELFENGKNLRAIYIHSVLAFSYNDITIINKTQGSKNLRFELITHPGTISLLEDNVCKFIVKLHFVTNNENDDYSLMVKMINLETFVMQELKQLKALLQGSFPKLTEISVCESLVKMKHVCDNLCVLQSSLHQLLVDKGNQLTKLTFHDVCYLDAHLVALKYCKAAVVIKIDNYENLGDATTFEDVLAILNLPNLQNLRIRGKGDDLYPIYNLAKMIAKEKKYFKIEYITLSELKKDLLLTRIVN